MRWRGNLLFVSMAFCVVSLLASPAFAQDNAVKGINPCAAPNIRADVRPNAGGPPTEVSVGNSMNDLLEINDPNQTLTGDFGVELTWTDPRLAHLEGCKISLDDIWSPGLDFINSGRRFQTRPREVGIGPDGSVQYMQRHYGTMATYHELHDFPLDSQIIRLSVMPFEWTEEDVQLVVNEKVTGRRGLLNISDWKVEEVKGAIRSRKKDAQEGSASVYDFLITAHRFTSYYLWKVILPLCLIVAMSWCVFWIDPALYGPQIGLSATSMLTLIAFIFATTNMVPELGYFTRLDLFIGGSTILVFLALLESLTVTYLVSGDRKKLANRFDRACRFVFPLAFAVLFVVVLFR